MSKYYIWTLGCTKSQAESERLDGLFQQRGLRVTTTAGEADTIVLNSCAVRHAFGSPILSKLKVITPLKELNPGLVLAVTGCLATAGAGYLKKEFPMVDHFFKPGEFPPWLEKIEPTAVLPQRPLTNVHVPVIQGCDNACSYCAVPFGRGQAVSRPLAEILDEARDLVSRGAKEVTLLVQNNDSYGHDLPDKPGLADLRDALNTIDGLVRLNSVSCSGRVPCPAIISGL